MCAVQCVILAEYWLWLPDDGFLVNQNMLEWPPLFLKCFNNATFFNVVCISWTIKCLVIAFLSVCVGVDVYCHIL